MANSRHQKSTASRPEHHVAVPQRTDAEDLDGCTAPGSTCSKSGWRIHRTVQEAEKHRDENEAKQGEDSRRRAEIAERMAKEQEASWDNLRKQSEEAQKLREETAKKMNIMRWTPITRLRLLTPTCTIARSRSWGSITRATEEMQNTAQQFQAADETLSRSESLGVPPCEGSVNAPRAQSATYTAVSSTLTTTTTTNGLALCHDVTLDIVTHRWVPVDTHSTPVPERGGCGWPSTNTPHGVRRSTGHNITTMLTESENNVALSCSFNWNTILANFHAASRAPCSCHSVSSWNRSSNFGALGLRSWGSSGQIYPTEGFWSRILVWRAIASVNFTRWIGSRMSVPFRRIEFGGSMFWNTQPNCLASENWRLDEFRPNFFLIFSSHKFPHSIVTSIWDGFSLADSLFQHSHSTLVIIRFRPFLRLCVNLTMCEWALHPTTATILGLVEQAFWRVPFFTERVIASTSKAILARPSRHSTARALSSGTSGPRWYSLILLHEKIRRRIWWCNFSTLLISWRKLQLSPLIRSPLDSHCQQPPRTHCTRCFVPWFLTTAFFSKFPLLFPKFSFRISSSILLFTIVFNMWWSSPNFFWWISRSFNSNTVLSFSDSYS